MGTKTIPTWEEFLSTAREGCKSEWVDGEFQNMSPANLYHELILSRLMALFVEFCRSHGDWIWLPSNAVFTMKSGNWRCPDVSLVRRTRLGQGTLPPNRADFPPDVACEIISPSESASQIQRKRRDYTESGVIQIWIDPERRSIELIEPDQPLRYFQGCEPMVIFRLAGFLVIPEDLFKI